jgi:hypothetical protein
VSLNVVRLNTQGFLEVFGAYQLVHERMIGRNLPFNVRLEGFDLNFAGARKTSHRLFKQINVVLVAPRDCSSVSIIMARTASRGFFPASP